MHRIDSRPTGPTSSIRGGALASLRTGWIRGPEPSVSQTQNGSETQASSFILPKAASPSLLLRELGCPDVIAPQLDVQHLLHGAEHLLVGLRGAALEVGDDRRRGVAAGGEVLLGHLGLDLLAGLGDGGADVLADGVGLDDVVGAVDLGEALAIGVALGGLCRGGRLACHVRGGLWWGKGQRSGQVAVVGGLRRW